MELRLMMVFIGEIISYSMLVILFMLICGLIRGLGEVLNK